MELILEVVKWSAIIGAFAFALTLLKPLLDKRYSAKWRYGAWLVMAVLLLLAPVRWETAPQAPIAPAVVIEVPKVEVAVSRQDGVSIQRPAGKTQTVTPTTKAPATKNKTFPMDELALTLWATGAALFLLYHGLGTGYFSRRARRWSRRAEEETLRIYEAVRQDMGLIRAPELRISSAVDSPMMLGLFHPRLLLPSEDFGELELSFILRHELTHHRRHDLWYKLLLTLANALHWFNPLIYLLRREAERDLELTCDDAVVAGAGTEVRRAYSETLLASIHRQKALSRAVLSTHFYGGKEVMKERFRNILGKRGRKWGVLALVVVLLATVAAACTFSLKPSEDGELTAEELAQWEEKVNAPEGLGQYLWCMYTDRSQIPSEECIECTNDLQRSIRIYQEQNTTVKVLSGTKSGDTVTLELEGAFRTNLPTGTLTLVSEEPVSFTTPLYTSVEAAALEIMDSAADTYIEEAKTYQGTELEFPEEYITDLFCSETMEIDNKTYYTWELFYRLKPNDIDNIFFVGGMADDEGWMTESQSVGRPIIIASVDADGNVAIEDQTYDSVIWEDSLTWEEYVYCNVHLGMNAGGILNGWPELTTPFLESLRNGHDTWALDWQDTALSYLSSVYDVYPDSGLTELRGFTADENENAHDQAIVVQGQCGERTVTLFLAQISYPVEVWDTTMRFWQVCGVLWEPDAPAQTPDESSPAEPQSGELTADEMASLASSFNVRQSNGLLRFPYENLGDVQPYVSLLFYDMGESVTDPDEMAAVIDAFFDGEPPEIDCTKLTRDVAFYYLYENIAEGDGDSSWLAEPEGIDLPYLEQYDSYYMFHSDTMMNGYTFDRGERDEDGTVRLYYTTDLWQYDSNGELDLRWDQPMCATMRPHPDGGEGWLMISNTIVE